MIITFSGTDGAGKSTQIELLVDKLSREGKRHTYLWARGGYTPGFSMLKRIARNLLGKKAPSAGDSTRRDQLMNETKVSKLWIYIATLDLILLYGLYLRYLNLRTDVVLCDRYLSDTELDFTRHHAASFNRKGLLWTSLLWLAPKPYLQFLLHVPVEVSQKRSKLKNEPFPDSPETLAFRLSNYLNEDRFPPNRYVKIDCTQSIDKIHDEIVSNVENAKSED